MTISLLRFPFLVQKEIFEEIDLLAVISITMLSKKSNATARACLRHHNYHLRYVEDQSIRLERKFEKADGHILDIVLFEQAWPLFPCQLWRIGNQEVPIKSTSINSNGAIATLTDAYCDNRLNTATEILQYLSRLLPKLSLTLKLKARTVDTFRRTMQSVECVKEIREIYVGSWGEDPVRPDELVKLVLDEAQRAKYLSIHFLTSDNFEYPTNVPFKFDSVSMISAKWITRDHFIKMFLSCKKVQLQWKNFTDEDLVAIFKAWAEGSRLEYLQLDGLWNFYQGKTLGSVLEEFPGAAPVRKAIVPVASIRDSRQVSTNGKIPSTFLRNVPDKTMTISLLRFPFLVQKEIFEEIDLLAVLSITTLSKKSQAIVIACLRHHKYHLCYDEDYNILLERKFGKEDGHILNLVLIDQARPLFPCQLRRIGNQEVPIKSTTIESNGLITTLTEVYCDNILDFAMETLQYLSRLLPRLSVTMELKAHDVDTFRRTMRSVESVGEIKEITVVESFRNRYPDPQDEYVKLVLEESQRVKQLAIRVRTSDNFEYPTRVPFQFDSISMVSAGWISREHFIKLFLSCKTVVLERKNFNNEDLVAIFKSWTDGSRLEYLQFHGTFGFYHGKTLTEIVGELPGATAVRNAIVPTGSTFRVVTFGEDECFLIQQSDGQTRALVYIVYHTIMLSTNFRIGKDVDEEVARIEEERHHLDENMGAEED
ncbi:unnamed protein product [Caenorhabditis brenneri]